MKNLLYLLLLLPLIACVKEDKITKDEPVELRQGKYVNQTIHAVIGVPINACAYTGYATIDTIQIVDSTYITDFQFVYDGAFNIQELEDYADFVALKLGEWGFLCNSDIDGDGMDDSGELRVGVNYKMTTPCPENPPTTYSGIQRVYIDFCVGGFSEDHIDQWGGLPIRRVTITYQNGLDGRDSSCNPNCSMGPILHSNATVYTNDPQGCAIWGFEPQNYYEYTAACPR